MTKFNFKLQTDDDLILVQVLVNNFPLTLALDTAASQTVIDWNALYLAGCSMPYENDFDETVPVETASGVIHVPTYNVNDFNALGIQAKDFSVITYDFLARGLTSPYDGVLGIDFFRKKWILTIDFIEEQLFLATKKK